MGEKRGIGLPSFLVASIGFACYSAWDMLRILTGNIDNFGGEYLGDPGEIRR